MSISLQAVVLSSAILCQALWSWIEDRRSPPPGQQIQVEGGRLHFYVQGQGSPTIVIDHSLGGIEGYFLIDSLAQLTRVVIYDRAGYGWSDPSLQPRTSEQIVKELNALLENGGIEPPYILIGDSFGSYTVRLYTHCYPEKVVGLVLTDALHEASMLNLPISLRGLQLFFASGFYMSTLGSLLGIIRIINIIGGFEILKPSLRQFPKPRLQQVKRSFCRPKHWFTMSREILNLDRSGRQVSVATHRHDSPIVSIKAASFFRPSLWTSVLPIKSADRIRNQIHQKLLDLSSDVTLLEAKESSHFIWIDQPDLIVEAVQILLKKIRLHPSSIPGESPQENHRSVEF